MNKINVKEEISSTYSPFEILHPLEDTIAELEARIKKLSDICTELNPYEPISESMKMRLLDLNILDFSDPFKITNTLLMLLEDTIDELHVFKPFNDQDSLVKEIL